MGATLLILLLYLIFVPVTLSDTPSVQEILRDFSFFKGEKGHLTLKDNPHFYAELPTSLEAHGDIVKINPTEDFRRAVKFYVLTDKQEVVHIMTGSKILLSFGNLWRSQNTIILKGSGVFLGVSPDSDPLTDICGRLIGKSIVEASLKGTFRECYATRLPISTVPRAFRTRNDLGLHSIGTKLYPWTGWDRFIDSPPMDSSVDFCSVCILTKHAVPNSPVRSKAITYLTTSANFNVAPGPLATNV